jgi:hypothetical protein
MISCCKDCKPPKRYPGCGEHCPEYKKEKAEHIADEKRKKEYIKKSNPVLRTYDFEKLRS